MFILCVLFTIYLHFVGLVGISRSKQTQFENEMKIHLLQVNEMLVDFGDSSSGR